MYSVEQDIVTAQSDSEERLWRHKCAKHVRAQASSVHASALMEY